MERGVEVDTFLKELVSSEGWKPGDILWAAGMSTPYQFQAYLWDMPAPDFTEALRPLADLLVKDEWMTFHIMCFNSMCDDIQLILLATSKGVFFMNQKAAEELLCDEAGIETLKSLRRSQLYTD